MSQNNIRKSPVNKLGYNFIKPEYLPEGVDEYYLRDLQNRSGIDYRNLSAYEIEALVKNRNASDDWTKILVSDDFDPDLVKNCKFFGLVRIGKLEPVYLEFSDMKYTVGLYNSTIISCDLGDNVVVDNVNYLSHYVIGNEVIIVNVNEAATTDHAKFGNGILKQGEPEAMRIWMEICNENGGRSVIPFNGMLPADAWLWSKYRNDKTLLEKFKIFTEQQFKTERGYYGKIGDRTVIKNCAIIKDVWIGSDAYIKGANKLKNLTINSGPEGTSQIGEGCELVNGIIGFGCRIFYGVKAVRFVMASNSQLKYGARLINSYLGNNATISCCEVLNSLIFPAHEQHHNNSFLCAALVMGQSNIPAGATIGSNHNSRAADGEIVAGRGFWPGLCVSLKHNSRFASFTILAKADYSYELNIPIPFSLVSIDQAKDRLVIMPAYWFLYNMYALARNAWKYGDRDKRIQPIQQLEYDYLAPDTINEMFTALNLFELYTGRAYFAQQEEETQLDDEACIKKGKQLLTTNDAIVDTLEIVAPDFENNRRKTVIIKVQQAYNVFKQMIHYYGAIHLVAFAKANKVTSVDALKQAFPKGLVRGQWLNAGGQLMPEKDVSALRTAVNKGKIVSWDEVHQYYNELAESYNERKTIHAISALFEVQGVKPARLNAEMLAAIFTEVVKTKEWMTDKIVESRAKDYSNPFRSMIYDSKEEMDEVIGTLEDNSFIKQQREELVAFKKNVRSIANKLKQ